MTDDELARIRARHAAATPGPWSLTYSGIDAPSDTVLYIHEYPDGSASIETDVHDAEFINHAYADITMLLALVDEQAATIARLVDLVHSFVDDPCAGRYTEGLSGEDRCTYCSFDIITYEHDTDCIIVRARAALAGAPDGEIGA